MTREEAIDILKNVDDNIKYDAEYGVYFTNKWLGAYEMAISALREQPRWISVEERLPEYDQRVLCRYTFGDDGLMYFYQVLDYYATDPQPHFQHTLGDSKMRVTHWMPLPEPPKEEGGSMSRISKREYYLNIAAAVAQRSTCIRRQYGAVIVKDDQIISTGYNGSARGEENCCDVGYCWREAHNVPHGEQYEKCVAVHAEDNAISQAGRESIGATLYLAGFENGKRIAAKPCVMCERKIKNAGIAEVVTHE